MSICDQKPIEQHVQELDESIQNRIAGCLSSGAIIIETSDPEVVLHKIEQMIQPCYEVIGNGVEAEWLKRQQGRPIIRWDVKSFRKNDAIGSMYKISKLPKEPKPIIIIENIAEIPDGDRNVYDDPGLVENILLHSWKNVIIPLTHYQDGPFQLNRMNYSVIFPIRPGELTKLYHSPKGEVAFLKF